MPMSSPYPLTRGVKYLLILNGVVFLFQVLPAAGRLLVDWFSLVSFDVFARGQVWRLVSYMFLHSTATLSHLLLNMLALWMFGGELEQLWGTRRFAGLYFLFGIGSGLFSVLYLVDPVMRSAPVIGASGAIFGLLTAYAVYFPDREILLFFVLPVRAWMLVAGYAVLSLFFAFSQGAGVAHLIHFGGIAVAFGYLKGFPLVARRLSEVKAGMKEKKARSNVEQAFSRKRYYDEKVDPILEKIAREGMGSLTDEEKRILTEAGKHGEERKNVFPFQKPRY